MNNNTEIKKFKQYSSGIIVVRSVNSNFNADFTGTPRRLPDEKGTIYATDKSLKYCLRKYLNDNIEGNKIFTWRRKKDNDQPMSINENYETLFKKSLEETDKLSVIKALLSCIDVRMFGITFAPKTPQGKEPKNLSITGPIQVSYGIDKYGENIHYTNQILSPYRDPGEKKEKKEAQQTTIGEESKGLESHYVFDYIINYRHLDDDIAHLKMKDVFLSEKDILFFKEAARLGVNNVNSSSKIGSENELLLYIEYPLPLCLQNLKDFVKITRGEDKDDNRRIVDLKQLDYYLFGKEEKQQGVLKQGNFNEDDVNVEVYYDPSKTVIKGFETRKKVIIKHIITGKDF